MLVQVEVINPPLSAVDLLAVDAILDKRYDVRREIRFKVLVLLQEEKVFEDHDNLS